jgi:hypothetical protein
VSIPRSRPRPKKRGSRLVSLPNQASDLQTPHAGPDGLTGEHRHVIRDLVELLKQHDLAEMEVEHQGFRVRVRRETRPGPGSTVTVERAVTVQDIQEESRAVSASEGSSGKVTVTSRMNPIVTSDATESQALARIALYPDRAELRRDDRDLDNEVTRQVLLRRPLLNGSRVPRYYRSLRGGCRSE